MSAVLWLHLLALLALETLLLVGLAEGASAFCRHPRVRRAVWQAALLGVAALWLAELGGVRARPEASGSDRPSRKGVVGPGRSTLTWVPSDAPTATEPAGTPEGAVPGTWRWPAWLWLAGTFALVVRASGLRFILAMKVRGRAQPLHRAGVPVGGWTGLCERLGVHRVRVLRLEGLRGPVAFGVFRPTVVLPTDFAVRFNPVQRQAMLAHELAHLAGRDPLWRWLADLVIALAWWHPGVWWARARLRAASEATADAASALVPQGPIALAESLLGLGRELAMPGGLGVAGSGRVSDLTRRVRALLAPDVAWAHPGRRSWLWPRLGVAGVTALLLLTPTGSGQSPWRALAGATDSPSREDRQIQTASDLLGDPRFREVVEALHASPPVPTNRSVSKGHPEIGLLPTTAGDEAVAPSNGPPVESFNTDSGIALSLPVNRVYVSLREPNHADLVGSRGGPDSTLLAPAVVSSDPGQVELRVTLVELIGGGPDELGLDWLFGGSESGSPVAEVRSPAGSEPLGDSPMAGSVTLERLATQGEWVALATSQYDALLGQLERRGNVDVLRAPRVTTQVGRPAQVSFTEVRTVVTGPRVQPATAENGTHLLYESAQVPVGPVVDLTAHLRDGDWEVAIGAAVNEFLGYDEPSKSQRVRGPDGVVGNAALPRLRVRVAEGVGRCRPGEVIALRGPLVRETIRHVDRVPVLGRIPLLGRAFTSKGTHVRERRLFVFVEPVAVSATGEPAR